MKYLIFDSVAAAALAACASENEGFAIGALTDSGILFVSAYSDLFESTVTLAGIVCALHNGACARDRSA